MDANRQRDRRRLVRALLASATLVTVLAWIHLLQGWAPLSALVLRPGEAIGLLGVLGAPLLHGSMQHLLANAGALMVLGTLALSVYPRASLRAVPTIWILSGIGVWFIGSPPGHIGASGITHGLMFFVFFLGLLRRDRPAIAAGMIAFFLYGGMVMTVLPREPGVSWEYHLCGALAGVLSAVLWRRLDPTPPRKRYSWEIEEEAEANAPPDDASQFEPPRPADVPVLWNRPADGSADEPQRRGQVVAFRRPGNAGDDERP